MRYNAVIFDFDGTLAATGADIWQSVQFAAEQIGGQLPEDFVAVPSNLTLSMDEIFHAIEPRPDMEKLHCFIGKIKNHYRRINEYPATHLQAGISELLCVLATHHIPCYIVTLKPIEPLLRILNIKKWARHFTGWYSPDSYEGESLSKRELIGRLLRNKLSDDYPVYIGDCAGDITAAHANGIDCIGVTYGDGDVNKLIEAKPDYLIDDAHEIAKIIFPEKVKQC